MKEFDPLDREPIGRFDILARGTGPRFEVDLLALAMAQRAAETFGATTES